MPDQCDNATASSSRSDVSWLGRPIDVRPLFAAQHASYIQLLGGLTDSDWGRITPCPGWTVKDIAAHVLADHAGRLSAWRDGYQVLSPNNGETFPGFIHRINDEWVLAARRLSPRILVDLSAELGAQVTQFWQTVDFDGLGWPVSWAGPEPAPLWLDAARDFTEYWTHQQQIREAVNKAALADPAHLATVIDTFLRALPYTLREVHAPEWTTVRMTVTGAGGGTWTCARTASRWALRDRDHSDEPDAGIELDTDTTWRLCVRAITPGQAVARARIQGDERLATAALNIISIIR